MTANLAYAPATRPARQQPPRPQIEIVSTRAQRKARPKLVYALAAMGGLFAIFMAQLLLSIALSDAAYQISTLQSQRKELVRTEQSLQETLQRLDSSQYLAAQAEGLGMVPSANPAYLYLSSGTVVGAPGAVDGKSCGGSCNLVANALLGDVALVIPPETPTSGEPASPPVGLPSPVTH